MGRRVILVALLSCLGSGGRTAIAEQQAVQVPPDPGRPTQAKVYIINRDRADAVPVTIQAVAAKEAVRVSVSGTPTVELSNTPVNVRRARQVWEYRQITAPANVDPTPALNTAGGEGWELVGTPVTLANGDARFLLKRPR
jgi:hypothetical protein